MRIIGCSFSQGRTFVAKTIRWFTKGPSHVYMHVEGIPGLDRVILHSTDGGVRFDILEHFIIRHDHKITHTVLFREPIENISGFVQDRLGKKYDTAGLLGNGLARILSWVSGGRWGKKNPWRSDLEVCSELANNLLKFQIRTNFDPDMVSPGELLKFMKEHPEHFTVID